MAICRYWKTGLSPLPNVLIRPFQSRGYSRHAHAWPSGTYLNPPTGSQLQPSPN